MHAFTRQGRKYVLLEGKSVPKEGPRGLQVTVLRQWVAYPDAVNLLKNGFEAEDGAGGPGGPGGPGAGAEASVEDDGPSPFYGGNVPLM